ncbi:hypothetical protein [Aestuariivivens insulae]|uniref:hypothetical protein n=1 Tax=Aestuariivivens insulae TaxID=1621988 RepID=UPI001F566563|nr:hypothetical protein [Aestuariivivens insulae]
MKKLFVLFSIVFVIIACNDKKKEDNKDIEQAILKIDSIEASIKSSIENLENLTNDVEAQLQELDNI